MGDNRITITFNNFEDFRQFLMDPGTVRLNQIASGKTGYAETVQDITQAPKEVVRKAQRSIARVSRPKRATPSQAKKMRAALLSNLAQHVQTHAGPMAAGDLVRKALAQVGKRATERNVSVANTTLVRMTNVGEVKRTSRGFYTVPAGSSHPGLKKTGAKAVSKK